MFWYGVFLDPYRTRCSGSKMGPACVRQRRSIAVALGAVRFMLAPCSPACNPYGPAGGAVRSVIRKLKDMRADACIKLVAPVGTDLTAISDRKRNAFKSQVRVRVQLGSFPEVVTIKLADDTAIKVGADLAIRDHLTVELTTRALTAIKKMVKALQRSPLAPSYFVCVVLRMRSTRAPSPRRAAMTATPPRGTVMTAARVTPPIPRHRPPAPLKRLRGSGGFSAESATRPSARSRMRTVSHATSGNVSSQNQRASSTSARRTKMPAIGLLVAFRSRHTPRGCGVQLRMQLRMHVGARGARERVAPS